MIPDHPARQSTRLEPETAWTVLTEAPLKGLSFAREAGTILAWDEADQLYQIDRLGDYRSVARAPGKVMMAAASDNGSRIVLLGERGRLWLLDADLGVVAERPTPPEPLTVAIDPHGNYVALSSRTCSNFFYNLHGKPAGKFQSLQPLTCMTFVPGLPFLIAAASYGMIVAIDLSAGGSGRLAAEEAWVDRQIGGVGRLSTTGDASLILASCYNLGIQRYDVHGQNEGGYHLGGTTTHAMPDFAGRIIGVATAEGEIVVINSAGNVRWRTGLPRPAIALETDPLGRYLIYGQASGEVVRLDLYPSETPRKRSTRPASHGYPETREAESTAAVRSTGGTVRKPTWTLPVFSTDDQAETCVSTLLDAPPRIALLTSSLKLQLLSLEGQNLGHAPEILGVGRIIRTAPGWIAAATDRQVVVYHATRNVAQRVDLSLVELTHLAIRPDSFGLALVQERDRVGRATIAGRWIWKKELKSAVEDLAIGPEGYSAITTDLGTLIVYDAGGVTAGEYQSDPAEPLSLIDAVDGPARVVWMTLARRSEVLRGHDLKGRVVWESPVPWEGWQFQRLGPLAVVSAPDGRALAYDGAGHLHGQGRSTDGGKDLFGVSAEGKPRRVSRQGVNLICSDFDGRVRWRSVCEEPLGPVAVGSAGVAAIIGRSLAWFEGLG